MIINFRNKPAIILNKIDHDTIYRVFYDDSIAWFIEIGDEYYKIENKCEDLNNVSVNITNNDYSTYLNTIYLSRDIWEQIDL